MRNYIYLMLGFVFFLSCEESDLTNFTEPDAVYFQLEKTDYSLYHTSWFNWLKYEGDSVTYSFGGLPIDHPDYKEKDTIWLQVNVLGRISSLDRNYKVEVNPSESTADESVHYEPLEGQYTMEADTVNTSFPVVILNHESLGEEPLSLYLNLVENDDFTLGLEGRTHARILIYNDVTKPEIWDQFLYGHLGPYSKAKHKVILMTNGGKIVPHTRNDYYAVGGYWEIRSWRAPMNEYLEANEVYDENGNRVEPW
ncbi:MAG: DUF4843 domain-containing protein [Carboxylicivirga sp.]|nr:DUF4843 domain-containing protein [Carboxylicivirga sp.]